MCSRFSGGVVVRFLRRFRTRADSVIFYRRATAFSFSSFVFVPLYYHHHGAAATVSRYFHSISWYRFACSELPTNPIEYLEYRRSAHSFISSETRVSHEPASDQQRDIALATSDDANGG